MDLALAMLICALGGVVAGLIGVGGGIVFVPAMTVLLSKGQVEAESTSLLMIALVSVIGAWRQKSYGNVNFRDAMLIGALSPVGVVVGVVLANLLPERALRIAFAMLALYMAWRLLKRAFASDHPDPHVPEIAGPPDPGSRS
ncbi:MAG: sulfite exporter TauE/SafE family protein [Solirubrobacterales bacterium]